MKQRILIIVLLLTASFRLSGQNNPQQIDDTCYELYLKTDLLAGQDGFDDACDALYAAALACGDKKAETLCYVERLKNLTRRPASPENDEAVKRAATQLKEKSIEYGYKQYYYYTYNLTQNYYYRSRRVKIALEQLKEMQQTALDEKDEYGLWMADRYIADLYISLNDYVSAKQYLLRSLKIYDNTHDETILRQSPTRLYCDLAECYPVGSDSTHIYLYKAREAAIQPIDSVRADYHYARMIALRGDDDELYRQLRDRCLQSPYMPTVRKDGVLFFDLMDAAIDGSIVDRKDEVLSINNAREVKVLANLCENRGLKDFAFEVEKGLVQRLERLISTSNNSSVMEMDVSMGKAALNAELNDKKMEIEHIQFVLLITGLLLFLAIAAFSIFYIYSLKKQQEIDRKHIEELKEANEKVRMADAAKTRFVQNMSHEVRTPLNAIVGFSQLLALPDGSLDPTEKDEFSRHIVNNTQMLTMLLDDILNASAMDSGNYRINYSEGEKDFMAQAAISSSEHRLQPGVRLSYVPEEPEPFSFVTDPRRVQQILINLITNACKHTSKGEIIVSSSLSAAPGYVSYAVTDTGTGVPPEQAEAIFERFTKLNEFVQGTGLGLSICRDIAGRMGAKVFLDTSYTAGGSRFLFQVPVEPPQNPDEL